MELSNIPVIRVNRHPILLDHDTQVVLEAKPGESLYAFLHRNVEDVTNLEVSIDGRVVDSMEWMSRNVTSGQEIVIRTTVHRAALYIVAMVALIYFTGGAAAAVAGGTSFGGIVTAGAIAGMSTAASMAAIGAVQIVGAMLINKVLGPKVPKPTSVERGSVYNIAAARNSARQWEPTGILFGSVQVTPDFAAKPFNRYIGNDQYMQMLLTPGINVARFHTLYFGDSPLSNFQGVTVKKRGFSDMPDDGLTSTTNVDTIAGGTLEANVPVIRTTPLGTGSIQVDISYLLFDLTTKGKKKNNQETVVVQVRKVGTTPWVTAGTYNLVNKEQTEQRRSFYHNVEEGQYEVSVRRLGLDTDGSGATCEFTLVSIAAYQVEQNNFDGVAVIQIDMKGTGQLNGAPDEVKAVMDAGALELWDGVQWKTVTEPGANGTSNPGAQVLKYARGFYDDAGNLIAGMGLDDDMIDIDALKALMVHCIENNIQYNMWVQDDRNHGEFLDAIMYPALGRVTMAPGRLTPIWAREDQGTSGIVNMGTIKKGEFQVNYTLVSAADGVEFTYIDRNTWETATLRVPAPGVDVMLNPATISGEGIIDEAQAAMQARYHLGQTLYQAKDITYSTNMQFLTYMEGDLLHMQHDITQWGFGGRLIDIKNSGGTITITVDDMVPGRDMRDAWVGLCIPGETGFRLFRVQPFVGERDTLTLLDPWPVDAEFPQNVGNKAIHDTTWIYDFKATPGALVRVVGMTPDDELKGASVSVVPESPNFWNFVKNGEYIPPNNDSLLNVKPIASALKVSENVVEQGNTVFTELQALWSITNNSARNVVTSGLVGEEPQIVAETTGLSAKWRIDGPGAYVVTVRPYAENGIPGVAVTAAYNTVDTALPPVNIDTFSVVDVGAGIRKYSWGFNPTTIQSPDFVGVEIRYVAGAVATPVWDDMTPVGADGFFTSAFESALPAAGQWTFAVRARNSAGMLSESAKVAVFNLAGSIVENIDEITSEQVAQQQAIDQEIADRIQADLNVATQAGADATAKANAARDAAIAHADVIGAQVADILEADEWVSTKTYPKGDLVKRLGKLYRALRENTNETPESAVADWQFIGNYTSLGEAVAASISIGTQNTSDIGVNSSQINSVVVRMPAGNGPLATAASVSDAVTAAATANSATAQRVGAIEVRVPAGDGLLETKARVDQVETALGNGIVATAERVGVLEAEIPDLATKASVTSVEQASVSRDNAMANSITSLRSQLGNTTTEYIRTGRFTIAGGVGAWPASWSVVGDPGTAEGAVMRVVVGGGYEGSIADAFPCQAGDVFEVSADSYGGYLAAGESSSFGLAFLNASGGYIAQPAPIAAATSGWAFKAKALLTAPTGAVSVQGVIFLHSPSGKAALWQNLSARKLSEGEVATATAVSGLTTQVSNQGGQLSALSQDVSQVTATANAATASITNLMEVTATSNAIGLVDGGFETAKGWGQWATVDTPNTTLPAKTQYRYDVKRSGARSLRFDSAISSAVSVFNNSWLRVQSGQKVRLTFWARITGSMPTSAGYIRTTVIRTFADGSNTYSGGGPSIPVTGLSSVWKKVTGTYTVPAGDAIHQWALQCLNDNPNTAVIVDDVSVELIGEEGEIARAKHTVTLDVNGNISGTVNENDGTRSSFSVLADVFRVISSGLTGFEIQGGYQRNYSSGAQLVMGHNFGSGDLIFWYGPNVGAAACNKANATIWFDKSGSAYFGGSLSAGVLKNSAQTTVLTANPTITVGPFSTNGKTKVVTVGYSANSPTYTQYYPGRPESAGPPDPPTISQAPKNVTLHRSYSGGATTQVASVPVSHGASVTRALYIPADAFDPNLPGGGWVQDYSWASGASLTYSDTLVGTGTFTYEAYAGSPTYTISRQTLSVTSVEQP